jgi:2-phospho-L-lactate guanylyltransferase
MRTLAVLPVKTFTEAKARLRRGLSPGERRALAEAMFCDVLIALRRTPSVQEILVVSADHAAQQIAAGYGARVLDDQEHGHNVAARHGIHAAIESGAERALLVPSDCPIVDPSELEALLARDAGGRSVLIVPDRHGTGTNALVLTPPDVLAPAFGPGSRERHLANAHDAGIEGEIVAVPSLAFDVDTPDDLEALQAALAQRHGGAAHTRGLFSQFARSRV